MPCDIGHYNDFMSLFRKAYCICHPTWSSETRSTAVKVETNTPSYSMPFTHVVRVVEELCSSQPLPSPRSLRDAERLE